MAKMTPVTPERATGAAPIAASSDASHVGPRTRPSWWLVASLTAIVVAVAVAGYALTSSPSLATRGAPLAQKDAAGDADKSREIGLEQIAQMVDKLAERMKSRPDDTEGWTMLARSYTVLGRYAEAVPAYRHATQLEPKNAGLLADFSDALATANQGHATPESLALLDRALALDPRQPKALALAGTIAFERGDYAGAALQWQKIADALPPDSEFRQQVQANVDEARRRGNLPAGEVSSQASASSTAAGGKSNRPADSNAASVSGTVALAPALAARASPTDTVFVFARPASGSRMPLAVFRATVADLPLNFRLDDSMAMTAMKLSDAKRVIVGARVSKSGNALPQSGDLSGESAPVAPGASGLSITIGEAVGAK
ncbi:MAG: tetratricopeptide repeat protein [Burkholderiaceae bacterium]